MSTGFRVQFIGNKSITAKVAASKIHINALESIATVIAMEALWGIAGMFLSIPLTVILKVIFDGIDGLKP